MQTPNGYIQQKDYLPKPDPFYHKGKPILIDGVWKLGWEENDELKNAYNRKQRLELIKNELFKIYDEQDEYLKIQFKTEREELTRLLDNEKFDTVTAILNSPYMQPDIKPIAQKLYNKFTELIGAYND